MLTIIPGDLSTEINGLDRLIAEVQDAPRKVLTWYGQTATERMKANHDRDAHNIQRYVNRTWYLTTTIGYDVAQITGGTTRVRMYSPASYAEAVEFGTPRSAPYPFFWIEVYGLQPMAEARLATAYYAAFARHEAAIKAS